MQARDLTDVRQTHRETCRLQPQNFFKQLKDDVLTALYSVRKQLKLAAYTHVFQERA